MWGITDTLNLFWTLVRPSFFPDQTSSVGEIHSPVPLQRPLPPTTGLLPNPWSRPGSVLVTGVGLQVRDTQQTPLRRGTASVSASPGGSVSGRDTSCAGTDVWGTEIGAGRASCGVTGARPRRPSLSSGYSSLGRGGEGTGSDGGTRSHRSRHVSTPVPRGQEGWSRRPPSVDPHAPPSLLEGGGEGCVGEVVDSTED